MQHALAPVIDGQRRVFCCHSGALSGRFAPNSLAAVQECVDAQVPRLEIDLRFTADDTMLVFHDSRLDRSTDGTGRADVLDRESAPRVSYRQDGSPLALFDEVVDALAGSGTLLQVDLKGMRPLSAARLHLLRETLSPLGDNLIVGTQAHWNLRAIAALGLPVAFDPTLHLHYDPARPAGKEWLPARMGVHGFWDDAPLASVPGVDAGDYLRSRLVDFVSLVPAVRELMIDIGTLLRMDDLGVAVGHELASMGVELAAWTAHDEGPAANAALVTRLAGLGATTIITDAPMPLAECAVSA